MIKKISVLKWVVVILLTLLVVPSILVSLFVLPVEMIALDQDSYSELLAEESINNQMRPVIAAVVTDQILLAENAYPVLSDVSKFETVIASYLPDEWKNGVLTELVGNTLDYFNFQTPYASIEIGILEFKQAIVNNSEKIAEDYVLSLGTCLAEDMDQASSATNLGDFPACKPGENHREKLSSLIAVYLEDRTNRLPSILNLAGIIPSGLVMGGNTFYWYSIARWVFRLLPFISLVLLISIALLLKSNKKVMRAWIGRIFLVLAGLLITASVVILIGLDQFIGLLFNQSFSMLIGTFGNVLLSIAHHIGYRILIWVIAQSGILFFVGLILMLASKYARKKISDGSEMGEENEEQVVDEPVEKAISPETLEEIEQAEQENGVSD